MKTMTTFCFLLAGAFGMLSAQVTSGADDNTPGTLRAEIAAASPGDIITFDPFVTTVDLDSAITINKNLTITGTGFAGNVLIDADNGSRIFNVIDGVVILNDLDFINGEDVDGGAIMNSTNLTINDCNFTDCIANATSGSGGAIFNDVDGVLTVNNTEFTNNTATRAGGAIEDNSGAGLGIILNNVTMTNNSASANPGNGGALHITGAGNSSISNSIATGNSAEAEGGALWNGTGTMTVTGSDISNNTVIGNGANQGGGALFNAGGNLVVENSTLNGNSTSGPSTSGGAILNDEGVLSVSNTTLDGNSSIRAGGAIEDNSISGNVLVLLNVDVLNNSTGATPGNGGGLHITGPGNSTITDSEFNGNSAEAEGGGIWNGTGAMSVNNTDVTNNTTIGNGADQGGAGIFNAGGTLVVSNSTINDNETTGLLTSGGGILNDLGILTVSNTTLDGNIAVRAGGAIEDNSASGNMLILDTVTMTNNDAGTTPGNGGGLHITGPGNSTIVDCIVSTNNAASEGGGLWNGTGNMIIRETTISGNTALGIDADNGGAGVFNNGGNLTINKNSVISGNIASGTSGSGGGLLSTAGTVIIDSTSFSNNSANRAGGAIEIIDGDLTFTSSSMIDNDVNGTAGTANPGNGGGLHVTGMSGNIVLVNSSFTGNDAGREGGALWNQSGTSMSVTDCTIDANGSFGPTQGGAGIFNNGGTLAVTSSTISNNVDDGTAASGAGIHNAASGSVTVMTSTISGNTSAIGGGVFTEGADLTINASTIAFNNGTLQGGGIESVTGVDIKNTIVANNISPVGVDVSGSSFTSSGYNLIGTDDDNAFTAATSDTVEVDPLLNALAIGTGITATHTLQNGSPAFNAGDPADMFVDQNGQSVFDGTRDIGADEAQTVLGLDSYINEYESNIEIFPNPTANISNVRIPSDFGNEVIVSVHSASTGILLKNFTTQSGVLTQVDLENYPAGMYIIKIQSDKFLGSQLITKMK